MAAMYSAANDGGMSPKKRNTRMTNLGFPGGARTPAATFPGSWRPNGFTNVPSRGAGMEGRLGGFTGTAGRGPGREGLFVPGGVGSVTVGNATTRDLVPTGTRTRGNRNIADLIGMLGRVAPRPAMMGVPAPVVAPVQNIGLPQGELPIVLPDLSGPDFAALRDRAMQDYFNQIAGLGL